MATDLGPTIGTGAQSPKEVTVDGVTVMAQPLPDVIQSDRYLAAKSSGKTRNRGMRFTKLIPAGPVSDSQGTNTGQGGSFDSPGF